MFFKIKFVTLQASGLLNTNCKLLITNKYMNCEKLPLKILLLAMPMLLSVASANAQSVLTVKFYTEETYKVSLAKKPEITFVGDEFVITGTGVSASFSRAGIKEYYFEDTPSSVKEVSKNTFKIEWRTNRLIYLYGDDLMPVRLFDLQGRERKTVLGRDGSGLALDLGHLEAGTYILTANHKRNIKINLR